MIDIKETIWFWDLEDNSARGIKVEEAIFDWDSLHRWIYNNKPEKNKKQSTDTEKKMLSFAKKIGWSIRGKKDVFQQFCQEPKRLVWIRKCLRTGFLITSLEKSGGSENYLPKIKRIKW